jgi:hypothetical protein
MAQMKLSMIAILGGALFGLVVNVGAQVDRCPLVKYGGHPIEAGDLAAFHAETLIFNGTAWELQETCVISCAGSSDGHCIPIVPPVVYTIGGDFALPPGMSTPKITAIYPLAPAVTIEGLGQDRKTKPLLTCDAIRGAFKNCVLAVGATLDDIAFWQGYSAKVMGDTFRDLEKQNAQLRANLKALKTRTK